MSNELEGKVAIVTGGASGLGEGLARRFAAEGAKVLIGDVDRDAGPVLAADIGADFVEADVSDLDQVSAVSTAVEHSRDLNVMVNNAGVSAPCTAGSSMTTWRTSRRSWHNLRAVMAGTRDAARHMQTPGRVDHHHRLIKACWPAAV
jgi:NAD(P)-dependent dehydrogenase (short-subunit alcohol dehydrogenase family)